MAIDWTCFVFALSSPGSGFDTLAEGLEKTVPLLEILRSQMIRKDLPIANEIYVTQMFIFNFFLSEKSKKKTFKIEVFSSEKKGLKFLK